MEKSKTKKQDIHSVRWERLSIFLQNYQKRSTSNYLQCNFSLFPVKYIKIYTT